MFELLEEINKDLEAIALEVVMLDVHDIPALGKMINRLDKMEEDSSRVGQPAFTELVTHFSIVRTSFFESYRTYPKTSDTVSPSITSSII